MMTTKNLLWATGAAFIFAAVVVASFVSGVASESKPVLLPAEYIDSSTTVPSSPLATTPDVKKVADLKIGKSCFVQIADSVVSLSADKEWRLWLHSKAPGYKERPKGMDSVQVTRRSEQQFDVELEGSEAAAWSNQYLRQFVGVSWDGPKEESIGTDVFSIGFIYDTSQPGHTWGTVPPERRLRRIWSLKAGEGGWISLGRIHTDADGVGWIDANASIRDRAFTDRIGPAVQFGMGKETHCAWIDLNGVTYKWRPQVKPENLAGERLGVTPGEGIRYTQIKVWYWKVPVVNPSFAGRTAGDVQAK